MSSPDRIRREELAQGASVAVLRTISPDVPLLRAEQTPALQKLESVAVKLSELVELIRGMADSPGYGAQGPALAAVGAKLPQPPVVASTQREACTLTATSLSEEATFGALMDRLLAPPTPLAVSSPLRAAVAVQPEPAATPVAEAKRAPAPLPAFSTRGRSEAIAAEAPSTAPAPSVAAADPAPKPSAAPVDAGAGDFYAALAAIQQSTDARRGAANSNASQPAAPARPVVATPPAPAEAIALAGDGVTVMAPVPAPIAKSRDVPPAAIEAAKNLEKLLTQLSARKAAAAANVDRPALPAAPRTPARQMPGAAFEAPGTKLASVTDSADAPPVLPAAHKSPTRPLAATNNAPVATRADAREANEGKAEILSAIKKMAPQLSEEAQLAIGHSGGVEPKGEGPRIEGPRIEGPRIEAALQINIPADKGVIAPDKTGRQEDRAAFVASMRKLIQDQGAASKAALPASEDESSLAMPQPAAPQAGEALKSVQRPTLGPKIPDVKITELHAAPNAGATPARAAVKPTLWREFVIAHRMKAAGFAVLAVGAGYLAAAPRMGDLRPLTDMMQDMRAKLNSIDGFASRDEVAILRRSVGEVKSGLEELGSSTAMAVADINARIDRLDRSPATGKESATPDRGRQPARAAERRPSAADAPPRTASAPKSAAAVPIPAATGLNQGFSLQTPLYLGSSAPSSEVTKVAAAPTSALKRAGDNSQGYVVREVYEGSAVVENAFGRRKISVGDILPGAGKVQAIELRDRQWVVVTSNGLIASAMN